MWTMDLPYETKTNKILGDGRQLLWNSWNTVGVSYVDADM